MNRLLKLTLGTSLAFLTTIGLLPGQAAAIDPNNRVELYPHHSHLRGGVEITRIGYRSPAALVGLEPGDIIVEVDGRAVRTSEELHRALYHTGQRGTLIVRNVRPGHYERVHVFPTAGHIGVTVVPVRY